MSTRTVTVGSKGQITVPAGVRRLLKVKRGARFDVYPIGRHLFVAKMHRPSKIMEYMGDLKHLDKPFPADRKAAERR